MDTGSPLLQEVSGMDAAERREMGGCRCHIWQGEMQMMGLEVKHLQLDLHGATTSSMNLVLKCFGSAAPMSTCASAPSTADIFAGTPKSHGCWTVDPLSVSPLQPQELVKRAWEVRRNTWSSPTSCGCIWILGVMISSWSPTPSLDAVPQLVSPLAGCLPPFVLAGRKQGFCLL